MTAYSIFALFVLTQLGDLISSMMARPYGYEHGPMMAPLMRVAGFYGAFAVKTPATCALTYGLILLMPYPVNVLGMAIVTTLSLFYAKVIWNNLRVARIVEN